MARLTDDERSELIRLLQAGEPIPAHWRGKLFADGPQSVEIGKEYRLEYAGKMKREQVLAETPAAPWQLVRRFAEDRSHGDGWRNLLVWGDNLLAMRELLADQQGPNKFGTKDKIKLIYIDPPFATRQDFMKDKEKAYRDKVLGAQFIEFLRRRLILLRELLADDGFIFVHLDGKKVHYIKAVMDEIFDETNFRNEIIIPRPFTKNLQQQFSAISSLNVKHDTLLCYSKNTETKFRPIWTNKEVILHPEGHWHHFWSTADRPTMRYELFGIKPTSGQWVWSEKKAKEAVASYSRYIEEGLSKGLSLAEYWVETGKQYRFIRKDDDGKPQYWRAPADQILADSMWLNVLTYENKKIYATQKHEDLLARVIRGYSKEGDIVLDCFAGSGTTSIVAEKLDRRWISMDCGKLALYTMQKRLFSMTSMIGAKKQDNRVANERILGWNDHLKSHPGILLITESANKGECEVTLDLLADLAALIKKHDLLKKKAPLSIACPEEKLCIPADRLEDADPDDGPGEKCVTVDGQEFRISLIAPKEKPPKEQPLPPKEFALYRAGLYDMAALREMPWQEYRPFVLKLFGVREELHSRYGMQLDGYIGTHATLVWNYPDHPGLTLDYGYVANLHQILKGKPGERFYVIAPVVAMDFAEDEIDHGGATYVFLKVPLSVLLRLLERREPGALKQPVREADVNEVIDAVGFDFISQPLVKYKAALKKNGLFQDLVVSIGEFRSKTLTTDPEDFANFETFSMAMVDLDYNGDVFRLGRVFWGEELLKEAGGLEKAKALEIRIPEQEFKSGKMMVILCDRYGNEKTLLFSREDFR